MSNIDIIRAWKDEDYRNSLSEEQRSQLPENPAGLIELSDEGMQTIGGGGAFSICWGKTRGCYLSTKDAACAVTKVTIQVCVPAITK